jgi:hypothetical protein
MVAENRSVTGRESRGEDARGESARVETVMMLAGIASEANEAPTEEEADEAETFAGIPEVKSDERVEEGTEKTVEERDVVMKEEWILGVTRRDRVIDEQHLENGETCTMMVGEIPIFRFACICWAFAMRCSISRRDGKLIRRHTERYA